MSSKRGYKGIVRGKLQGLIQRKYRPWFLRLQTQYVEPLVPVDSLEKCADNEPLQAVANPYAKEKAQCIICRFGIKFDYRNPRLLSQFVSSFSGRVYDRHVTGLCYHQQAQLIEQIRLSRRASFMPVFGKEPRFLKDPRLFDPMNPQRHNPF